MQMTISGIKRQADFPEIALGGWGAVGSKAGFAANPPDMVNVTSICGEWKTPKR